MTNNTANEIASSFSEKDIRERLRAGEAIRLSAAINTATSIEEVRQRVGDIIGAPLDETATLFAPFYTNFGQFTQIGKHVFINHACSFVDMDYIILEDHVLIGPKVNLIIENYPADPTNRRALVTKPILIKRNAWIGAAATILHGVTVGKNAIVAAGAVVYKAFLTNTVIEGVPAKFIRSIEP